MDNRLFIMGATGNDITISSALDIQYILERFTHSYSRYSVTFNSGAKVSQGIFLMHSMTQYKYSGSCYKNSQYNLGNLHFIPNTSSAWSPSVISFANSYQNPDNASSRPIIYLENNSEFNASITTNADLYTTNVLKNVYQIYPVITVNGYTNNRTIDMWDTGNNFPLICNMQGWYYNNHQKYTVSVPHVQQTEFNVLALDTDLDKIGISGWGKKIFNHIEFGKEFGRNGNLSAADYCEIAPTGADTTDGTAAVQKLKSKLKENTKYVTFVNELITISQQGAQPVCTTAGLSGDITYRTFRRNLHFISEFNQPIGTTSEAFYNNMFLNMTSTDHDKVTQIIGVPMIFTKIGGNSGSFGSYWQKNTYSLSAMILLCSCVAKKFAEDNSNYSNFVIYFTAESDAPETFSTLNISNAVDLRPVSQGSSASEGKVTIKNYLTCSDILAIANKHIYILSESQLQYITPPANITPNNLKI